MATITVTVQSLLNAATFPSYTVSDGVTVDAFKATIATAETTDPSWFNLVLNHQVLVGSSTLAAAGLVNGSVLYISNQIGHLSTLEARQTAKLTLAQTRRQAGGNTAAGYYRSLNTYDLNELPTQYSGNTIVDNPNIGGLITGRPWVINWTPGLYRTRYTGYFADNVNWFATAAVESATVNTSPLATTVSGPTTSEQWIGYFKPSTTDTYTFYLSSDDASYLWIGHVAETGFTTANALINNGGGHGTFEVSASITLDQDLYYPVRIQFGNGGGPWSFAFNYSTPTIAKTANVAGLIFYNPNTLGF